MLEVSDAPDAFASLADELAGTRAVKQPSDQDWFDLGEVPEWIRLKFFPRCNDDLRPPPTTLAKIRSALSSISPGTSPVRLRITA